MSAPVFVRLREAVDFWLPNFNNWDWTIKLLVAAGEAVLRSSAAPSEIDAAAQALRECEHVGNKRLAPWADIPEENREKWCHRVNVALMAAKIWRDTHKL